MKDPRVALTVAGSDSGGGAGIQADLQAFAAFGCHGASVVTALTAQGPAGVRGIEVVSDAFVRAQLDAVTADLPVHAIKTGMLPAADAARAVVELASARGIPLVVDPVMIATTGDRLVDDATIETLETALFPAATLLTPNLPEASFLLGRPLTSTDLERACEELADRYRCAVLMKGGDDVGEVVRDCLVDSGGRIVWEHQRLFPGEGVHGTGCTLAAAVAAGLAWGRTLREAVEDARAFVHAAIERSVVLGPGSRLLRWPRAEG